VGRGRKRGSSENAFISNEGKDRKRRLPERGRTPRLKVGARHPEKGKMKRREMLLSSKRLKETNTVILIQGATRRRITADDPVLRGTCTPRPAGGKR